MNNNAICLFYSPQGGAGKTSLAVFTAYKAASSGLRTLLVDMAIYGGVNSHLKLDTGSTEGVSDLISIINLGHANDINQFEEVLEASIHKEVEENLDVLISTDPIKIESMSEIHVDAILEGLESREYDVIIVDTSADLSEKNAVLFDRATQIVMPVIQDIHCGWKLVQFKEVLRKCGIDDSKVRLIVNRCSKHNEFNNKEYELETGFKIIGEMKDYKRKFQNQINGGKGLLQIKNRGMVRELSETALAVLSDTR